MHRRHGADGNLDRSLFYALNLNDPSCNTTLAPRLAGRVPPKAAAAIAAAGVPVTPNTIAVDSFPGHTIWVHPTDGNDANPGSWESPVQSIQHAVDMAADLEVQNKTVGLLYLLTIAGGLTVGCALQVVLRGGVHYLGDTLVMTSRHSHIRVVGMPGEKSTVSGGQLTSFASATALLHPCLRAHTWSPLLEPRETV